MTKSHPSFTIGVEEEYLLVDCDTLDLAEPPDSWMEECAAELGTQVSPEFLKCQVEIGTKVCANIHEARSELVRLRRGISKLAEKHGLAPIAASCHPFADYHDLHHTDKDRYNVLSRDLAGVARRLLICGQHVHVGIEDEDTRVDLMRQFTYFLPHLLALSSSSPFWRGEDTGLASYRLTVFDNLPRTGLPPAFESWSEYQRSLNTIIATGVIEDGTKIWWDLRPSSRFPTLENRICDVSSRIEDTLTIAALTQCLMRMLWRLRQKNQRWRVYDLFLIGENRWRAQRHGVSEGLIDFGVGEVIPFTQLVDELIDLISQDAKALNCEAEVARAREMVAEGTSADRQRRIYQNALDDGADNKTALRGVVSSLIDEFSQGL